MLSGVRVLLVEDESLVSLLAEDILSEAGCDVLLAMDLAGGIAAARHEGIDVAVVDVNLGGESSGAVADVLVERGVPFLFATGYGRAGLPAPHGARPVLEKPYLADALIGMVRAALGR